MQNSNSGFWIFLFLMVLVCIVAGTGWGYSQYNELLNKYNELSSQNGITQGVVEQLTVENNKLNTENTGLKTNAKNDQVKIETLIKEKEDLTQLALTCQDQLQESGKELEAAKDSQKTVLQENEDLKKQVLSLQNSPQPLSELSGNQPAKELKDYLPYALPSSLAVAFLSAVTYTRTRSATGEKNTKSVDRRIVEVKMTRREASEYGKRKARR